MPAKMTVADQIRQLMPTLPTAERRVARVVLANYPVAGLETVARLASRSGTSGPTVLRLATRLGMSGFPELQRALRDELDHRDQIPSNAQGERRDPAKDFASSAGAMLGKVVASSVGGVERTDFDQAIELLSNPRVRVVTTGGRFSGVVAEYLTAHLQLLRSGVSVLRMTDRVPALLDLSRRDVVVVFDFRRYQPDLLSFSRAAEKAGAQVVLITDPWMSPISTLATVVLRAEVAGMDPSPFDSLVPCMALVEALVAGMVSRQGNTASSARVERYERYWAEQFSAGHTELDTSDGLD